VLSKQVSENLLKSKKTLADQQKRNSTLQDLIQVEHKSA